MITVTVEQREGAVTRTLRVTASSIGRALELAGGEQRNARVIFPIEPEGFFAPEDRPEGIEPAARAAADEIPAMDQASAA